jgi:Tol biopolymer transport system component
LPAAVALALLVAAMLSGEVRGSQEQPTTRRVSVASSGRQGNEFSHAPSVSADGRFVAFRSLASNLVIGDTNGAGDIFVRDQKTGRTRRVSVASNGRQGNDSSEAPSVSADGRFVVFISGASNLVAGDTNDEYDVFLRDCKSGTTRRVNLTSHGRQAHGELGSYSASISANGRFITFSDDATNLVNRDLSNTDTPNIFLRDTKTHRTSLVNLDSHGELVSPSGFDAPISATGRFVAFDSDSGFLVKGDTNNTQDVFVRDRKTGTTSRVSVDSHGTQGNDGSDVGSISAGGRFVVFTSAASNLVSGDTNAARDVFVRDRKTDKTRRVSVDSHGRQVSGDDIFTGTSISADGRFVAFDSHASNLVKGDTNGEFDVFVRDRKTGKTRRVSVASNGRQAKGSSDAPSVSADGRFVAFVSGASNLVIGDTNGAGDIFMRGPLH